MIGWLLGAVAWAGAVGDGAAAFEAGQLDDAVAAWEAVRADGGEPSGVVEYDLGTAWYRRGDLARSAARFRAAARLRPRDGDVQHNLALARAGLEGVPEPVGELSVWMQIVTPGELGLAGIALTAVGSALVLAGRRNRSRRLPGVVAWGVGLGLGAVGAWGAHEQAAHPVAVVVDDEVVLRDAASVNAGERLRLMPGAEVRVQRAYGGFLLVEDGRGRRGWVASNAVELSWAGTVAPAG